MKRTQRHTFGKYNHSDMLEILGCCPNTLYKYCREKHIDIKRLTFKQLIEFVINYPKRKVGFNINPLELLKRGIDGKET